MPDDHPADPQADAAARRRLRAARQARWRAKAKAKSEADQLTPAPTPATPTAPTLATVDAPQVCRCDTVDGRHEGQRQTVAARREGSPLCVRDQATGRFPVRPSERVQVCPPCSQAQFESVNTRVLAGATTLEACKAEGLLWVAWRECGALKANVGRYNAVLHAEREQARAEIEETGRVLLRTAKAELPAREEFGETPAGPVSRRILERAASTAAQGAALLDPATHGRQAGRQAPALVNVMVPVQVVDSSRVVGATAIPEPIPDD